MDSGLVPTSSPHKHLIHRTPESLYDDLPPESGNFTLSSKLDLPLPNPAPEIEPEEEVHVIKAPAAVHHYPPPPPPMDLSDEPKKKKYAKEAWPGKKAGTGNLLL